MLPPSFFNTTAIPFHDDLMTAFDYDLSDQQLVDQQDLPSEFIPASPTSVANSPPQCNHTRELQGNEFGQPASANPKRKYFTPEEDHQLTIAAMAYNQGSWNKIARCVPGRTPKQCRDRWVNYLQPYLKFEPWSEQEDQLLVSLVNSYGTHWAKFKVNFPNRSTNSLKNRWYWLVKNHLKAIPIEKPKYSSINNFQNNQNYNYNYNYNQTNIQNNNNLEKINQNIDFNYTFDNNSNQSQNPPDIEQPKNNQNYYYFLKSKNINSSKTTKRQYNLSIDNSNNSCKKKKNFQRNKLEANNGNIDENDIISFNPDEFEW